MISLERNRVFSISDIEGLNRHLSCLMDTAIEVSVIYNRAIAELKTLSAQVPTEAKDPFLSTHLYLALGNYVFPDYEDLQAQAMQWLGICTVDIPALDTAHVNSLESLNQDVSLREEIAEELKCMLEPGTMNLTIDEYMQKLTTLFPAENAVREVEPAPIYHNAILTADPVNAITGSFFFQETDLAIEGEPLIRFERMYDSLNRKRGILGRGWTCSLDELADTEEPAYIFRNQDGQIEKLMSDYGKYICFFYQDGRLVRLEDHTGRSICFSYERSRLISVADPLGRKKCYEYDRRNRIERIIDENSNVTIQNEYDEQHRVIRQLLADGGQISYRYVPERRYTEVTYQDGHKTRYHYNAGGEAVLVSDVKNHEVREPQGYRYHDRQKELQGAFTLEQDEQGRISRIRRGSKWDELTYGDNGCPDTVKIEGKYEFRFQYDACNRIIRKTDGNGNARDYSYDACSRLISTGYPDGSRTTYSYDPCGKITCITKNTGEEYRFAYDKGGRLKEAVRNGKESLKLSYDVMGNVAAIEIPGRGTLRFERREEIAETAVERKSAFAGRTEEATESSYDAAGNLIAQKFPDGREYRYSYDCMNRLTGMALEEGAWWHFAYGPDGKCIKKTDPLGNCTEFEYDENRNLIRIKDAEGSVFSLSRLRIPAGTSDAEPQEKKEQRENYPDYRVVETGSLPESGVSEKRDRCGRLIERCYPGGMRSVFTYCKGSRIGRITHMQGDGTILEDLEYAYDVLGNCTGIHRERKDCPEGSGCYAYHYDALGRLIRTERDGIILREYRYDGRGNRTGKTAGEDETVYSYGPHDELEQADGRNWQGNSPEQKRITCYRKNASEQLFHVQEGDDCYRLWVRGLPEMVEEGGSVRYLLTDHLGSVLREVSATGKTCAVYQYDEFGVTEGEEPAYAGYAGYIPAGRNLYATQTRYYEAETGRFHTRDEWIGGQGNPQTFNQWIYAINNPLRYRDGTGCSPEEPAIAFPYLPDPNEVTPPAPNFLMDMFMEGTASGQKSFSGESDTPTNQEMAMEWLTTGVDNLMDSSFGDVLSGVCMTTSAISQPGIIADAYLYEMLVEGRSFEESTREIQNGFRGYCEPFFRYIPEAFFNVIFLPDNIAAFTESVTTNGLFPTLGGMVNSAIDGVRETWEDRVINGTAQSRGEVVGEVAIVVIEAVLSYLAAKKAKADFDADVEAKKTRNNDVGGKGTGGTDTKIKPSNPYNVDAKPSGTVTKITDKMDEATKRSLMRENEAAETIAKNGYNIEQNPVTEGTTRNPDYIIEGEIFDCYSPAENTKIRNVASTIEEKVIKKGQTERVVLNLDDWKGDVNALVKQLNDYPIEGLKEVIVVHNGSVQSIYP